MKNRLVEVFLIYKEGKTKQMVSSTNTHSSLSIRKSVVGQSSIVKLNLSPVGFLVQIQYISGFGSE